MLLRGLLASSVVLLTAFCAQAKTLVISDIDDTIKNTHVLNWADAVGSQNLSDQEAFGAIAHVYNLLISQNPGTTIYYVSNGFRAGGFNLVPSVFLTTNDFPQSENLSLRSTWDGLTNTKVRRIVDLIYQIQPTSLILIGDNGEQDTEVYAEIQRIFPKIPATTYIHQVYSSQTTFETGKHLEKDQIGFVSSVDLAMDLFSKGIIKENGIDWLALQVHPSAKKLFVDWMNCYDYQLGAWAQTDATTGVSLIGNLKNEQTRQYLLKYVDVLKRRCSL